MGVFDWFGTLFGKEYPDELSVPTHRFDDLALYEIETLHTSLRQLVQTQMDYYKYANTTSASNHLLNEHMELYRETYQLFIEVDATVKKRIIDNHNDMLDRFLGK